MAAQAIPEPTTREPRPLSQEQESFCAWVASGITYSEAARRVGWTPANGLRVKDIPHIRERLTELIEARKTEDLGGIASKAWIETKLVSIVDRLESGSVDKDNLPVVQAEVTTLMALARLKGHVVERKATITARANLKGELDPDNVAEYLEALDPASRAEIEERVKSLEVRSTRRKRPAALSPGKVVDVEAEPADG